MRHPVRFALVLSVFVWTCTLQAQEPRKVALLVGVNVYQKPLFDPLDYAERDVEELGKELAKHGFTVVVLKGGGEGEAQATRENVLAKLHSLVKPIGRRDVVLVALSGHGQQLKVKDAEGNTREDGFYCPVDAVADTPETQVSLSFVTDQVLAKNGGRSLLLVDACRDVPKDQSRGRSRGIQGRTVELPEDVSILFSCRAGQQSWENHDFRHGLFSYCVLEGLRGRAAVDGEVDWDGLVAYVKRRMVSKEIAALIPRDRPQNPINAGGVEHTVLATSASPPPPPPRREKPELLIAPFSPSEARAARKAWAEYLGQPETFTNKIGMPFVLVPPGEFTMGTTGSVDDLVKAFPGSKPDYFEDEKPAHRVRITNPLYVGVHEVTRGQFRQFVTAESYQTEAERDGEGGYGWNEADGKFEGRKAQYTWKETGFPQTDRHPVVNVTWNDAQKFCEWLSRSEGKAYRLPTEAEWEYACRGGSPQPWYFGSDQLSMAAHGNIADQTAKAKWTNYKDFTYLEARDGSVFTAPVGTYTANPLGLYDVHGNVFEWCEDWYDAKQYSRRTDDMSIDPIGDGTEQQYRVVRGGSWYFDPRIARSADRNWNTPTYRLNVTGFRVVISARTP